MLKISKREAALIAVLLVVVAGYCVYNFFYLPKTAEMAVLQAELKTTLDEITNMEIKAASIPRLQKEIAVEEETARAGAPLFFDDIVQENLIVLLSKMAREASFNVESYGFSYAEVAALPVIPPSGGPLQYYLRQLVDSYKISYEGYPLPVTPAQITDATSQLAKTSVTVSFKSTYNTLVKYIEVLEAYDKQITVNSIAVNSGDSDILSGSLTLEFYTLPKLYPDPSDLPFGKWQEDAAAPEGKANPFSGSAAAPAGTGMQQQPGEQQTAAPSAESAAPLTVTSVDPDFFLIARSASSDMPTLTLGAGSETQLRNTTAGRQDITVELTAADGKYYYRYRTGNTAYPQNAPAEFKPVRDGQIHFIIYSNKRVSGTDANTISLTIANSTGLPLAWGVVGDDEARPRVNVTVR